jgi:methionine sulfoxide reductase heme-binding subunit
LLTAAANTKALWYLTRGTGLVALLLLTLSVVLGIVETVRWSTPRWPRFITAALHKNVSLLVTVLLALHIITSIVDGFAPIRWLDAVVPFISAYRPVWLGLGALAVDLLIALVVTSLIRQHIGYQAWRAVHWSAYACWPVALVHGLGTGSDTRLGWVVALNVACVAAVIAAVCWRLASSSPIRNGTRVTAAFATAAAPVALVAWMVTGPMKAGWARHAGTPATLIAGSRPAVAKGAAASNGAGAGAFQPPFAASLTGKLVQTGPDSAGLSTITIDATLNNGATVAGGAFHLVLRGPASGGGGIRMQSSQATLGPPNQPTLYQGSVTTLQGTSLSLAMQDRAGRPLQLAVSLQIDQAGGVSGSVQGTSG